MLLWQYWQEDWLLYHKCIFDGVNKLIYVADNASSISVKMDVYSAWKEWSLLRENLKFLPAIRSIGGDPTGVGEYAGDIYFLMNGWRILLNYSVTITGVLYSDDYPSPFISLPGTQLVTNKVSSLVNTIGISGAAPTAQENANATWDTSINGHNIVGTFGRELQSVIEQTIVDTINSLVIPTPQQTANAVWDTATTGHNTAGTFGNYIQSKVLSVAKFLGLK